MIKLKPCLHCKGRCIPKLKQDQYVVYYECPKCFFRTGMIHKEIDSDYSKYDAYDIARFNWNELNNI